MSEAPVDYSWEVRLKRFSEVSRMNEKACWLAAQETDVYDMHSWLDLAEATLLTDTQRESLAQYSNYAKGN